MKQSLFSSLAAILILGLNAHAQVRTQSNHSISANILGLEYSYEQSLGSYDEGQACYYDRAPFLYESAAAGPSRKEYDEQQGQFYHVAVDRSPYAPGC